MMGAVQEALFSALATVLVAFIGYVANRAAAFLKEKGITEKMHTKRYLVDIAVNAAEQIYQNEDGATKLSKAREQALKLLTDNGLEITEEELMAFMESAVKAMNDGFNSVREVDLLQGFEVAKGDK